MKDDAASWPMDIEQLLSPVFRAEGFFVVILADTGEGQKTAVALEEAGVSRNDLKLYTSDDILGIHEQYLERRSTVAKVAGVFMDDDAGRDLYLGYARDGRCGLWVRLPDKADVPKVLRVLADFDYLHMRYYGADGQTDYQISRSETQPREPLDHADDPRRTDD
jgi:hypothetical protein